MVTKDDQYVQDLVKDCQARRFYGDLVLSFRAGEISIIRKTETILPPSKAEKPKEA